MREYRSRGISRAVLVAVVASLAVGLMAAPALAQTSKKQERRQNSQLKKNTKNIKKGTNGIKKGVRAVNGVKRNVKTLQTAGAALQVLANSLDADRKTLNGTLIPGFVSALTQLRDGLTAAGAGLTSLQKLATSTEYGFGQVVVGATPQGGSFVVTPDIPDAVQQAQTEQQFIAQTAGNITVLYGVRSFETDGDGTTPAAVCKVTVTNEAGVTQTTAANTALGGLPFQPVPTKSAPTSTVAANAGFPFGLKTAAPDADETVPFNSTVAVAPADTYTVGMSCVDTSPSSTDPSA